MPFFNESFENKQVKNHHRHTRYVYTLEDCFNRGVPVTSIEFNPPPVSCQEKQVSTYWRNLENPDEEDDRVLKSLKTKYRAIHNCIENQVFMSFTDSAAGVLRMHNLTMLSLLGDPAFCERHMSGNPLKFEPHSTVIHLTRNHSVRWISEFLNICRNMGFRQILVITGDPLKEVRLKMVTAQQAASLNEDELRSYRLKNSIELLRYIKDQGHDFFLGVGHNPFLKQAVSEKHLKAKLEAGAQFIITQPVAYYDECWAIMDRFMDFYKGIDCRAPVVIGVFNYSVPCGSKGFREDVFQKRHKFWKKLFGFVPEGVRQDYERGLNGTEILANSINTMKKKGFYHFDVMNAERKGLSILKSRQRMTHESDRLAGSFDQ